MPSSFDHLVDTITPHPDAVGLLRRATALQESPTRWSGVLYRAAEPKYARQSDRLDGIGACLNGGRWNPPGMRAVYGSRTPETAMAESLALYRHYNMPIHQAMPKTFFAFKSKPLARILNLADGSTRTRLRVSAGRMQSCDWRSANASNNESMTQAIARAALQAGFQGLMVQSACVCGETNVVLFPAAKGVSRCLTTLNSGNLSN